MIRFLDLARIHQGIRAELDTAATRVLDSGSFILGAEVDAFEREWAGYVGAGHAVGTSNGLDALTLALLAVGVGPGDEVLVPSNTFIATWLAVSRIGARPVPVEPDAGSFLVPASAFLSAVTERTRAVIPVDLYGLPAEVEELTEACRARGIAVIEDAAQAHGASRAGVRVGAAADLVCWSFYPGKNLGALGDAGAVTTDDASLAERVRLLANYGSPRKYEHVLQGANCRLDELQAAFLRAKLPHLDEHNACRARVAARYRAKITTSYVEVPVVDAGDEPSWHLYVVLTDHREALAEHLTSSGVQTLVHYPVPPHLQLAYSDQSWPALPVSEAIHRRCLSLPMGPHLSDDDVDAVIGAVNAFEPRG